MSTLILAVIVVLVASAICSGSEAALFSVPMIKVRQLAEDDKPAALALLRIREHMSRPIATTVTLHDAAQIPGQVLGTAWLGVFSGTLTFMVILFSEIIPKTVGEQYCQPISLFVSRPLLLITFMLTPVVWIIEKVTAPLTRGDNNFITDESEIMLMAQIGQDEGMIEEDESEMIQNIFKLNDIAATELMTPRVAMTHVKRDMTLMNYKDEIICSPHSRIIVVDETPDQVCGVVFKDELLIAMIDGKYDSVIEAFMHEVTFVPDSAKADQLLLNFKKNHQHIVVAVDEYAGVSGVVTLEDVLEVLTGEIVDETDLVTNLREFARKTQ